MKPRIRDLGYCPGQFSPGPLNSILDVQGVQVGQVTLNVGTDVHTGVTVIFPNGVKGSHTKPYYGATHSLNGAGELTGTHMLREWGYSNTPIAFTNTVSVGKVYDALILWQMEQVRKAGLDDLEAFRRFGIPIVGETFDGLLNDISLSVIEKKHVLEAVEAASTQEKVLEGNYGGGTAMRCHGFKAGTGTSSRIVPGDGKDYVVGVIVQANYGAMNDLKIGGVPVGKLLMKEAKEMRDTKTERENVVPIGGKAAEGSILVLTITDAPLLPHQLRRLAQRSSVGIAQVGGEGTGRNFSGEIFLAVSTGASPDPLAQNSDGFAYLPLLETHSVETVKNEVIDGLFYAVSEATEESILNALCAAESMKGFKGRETQAIPVHRVKELIEKYYVKTDTL